MEVYIVLHEWGEYEDWGMAVGGVFATQDAAEAHIRSQTVKLVRGEDGELVEPYMRDMVDSPSDVELAPVEHACPADSDGHGVGGNWHIDRDPRYDRDSWHIERWEVQR